MADYYGLLARAVQALRRNDKSSRLEIYAKARHALIRQLKAITPPLPPEEISKQRLSLEEAIRRVEREAAEAAAAAMLSEEEIGRQAERALEEALADTGLDDGYRGDQTYATDPYLEPVDEAPEETAYRQPPPAPERAPYRPPPPDRAAYRQPPPQRPPAPQYERAELGAERVQFEPPPRPEPRPEVISPRTSYADQAAPRRRDEAYAEVVTPPMRPRAPGPGAAGWDRGAPVTDVEAPSMPRTRRQAKREERLARARRGGRGWERPHKHASRQRMSMTARLTIVLLLLIVAGGVGYYVWQDWDNVSDFVTTLFTGEGAQVEAVAEEEIDPITGEPVVFAEPVAYYYDEPTGGEVSAKHGGTIAWALVDDALLGPVIAAHIDVPDRGLTFDVTFSTSANAAASHEVSVLTTATGNAEALRGVDNIAVKTSEESIGLELDGTVASAPGRYLLELPADAARLNANRFATSPWFDIALVFESGERAVVAFSKGTVGARLFRDAMAVWDGTAAAVP